MIREVVPPFVAGLFGEFLAGLLDPPPERPSRVAVDERLVRGLAPNVVDGPDRRREVAGDGRLSELVVLSFPHAESNPGVGVDDVLRRDVEHLVGTEAAPCAEGESDPLLSVVGDLKEEFDLLLREPHLHVVPFGVLFEIHGVRLACIPDDVRGKPSLFDGVRRVDRGQIVRLCETNRTSFVRLY